jgi:hypothetical protein
MNEDFRSLSAIDFLPQRYRDARVRRAASLWRLALVFVLAGMLLSAGFFQQRHLGNAQRDLAKVEFLHASAAKVASELAVEQHKFPAADQEAELLTYLRHPWPRTQVLAGILREVPTTMRLTNLTLTFDLPERRTAESDHTIKEDPVEKTPSAARNLKRLREELDGGHWVVSLRGTTSDLSDFHAYVAQLECNSIFAKVELVSIESPQSTEASLTRFAVRIVLKPGFGQPGGPAIEAASQSAGRAKQSNRPAFELFLNSATLLQVHSTQGAVS